MVDSKIFTPVHNALLASTPCEELHVVRNVDDMHKFAFIREKKATKQKITNTFPWQPHQKVDKTPYPKETSTNNDLSQLQDGFPMSKASFKNEKKICLE
jgi:hypothetical protein